MTQPAPADKGTTEDAGSSTSAAPKAKKKKPKTAAKPAANQQKAAAASQPAQKPADAPPGSAAARLEADRAALEKEKGELQQLRDTTHKLIKSLVARGLLPKEEAEEMVAESDRAAVIPAGPIAAAPVLAAAPAPGAVTTAPPATATSASPRVEAQAGAQADPAAREAAQAAAEAEDEKTIEPGTVRVPYVPEVVRNQIRDQVRNDVMTQAKAEGWAAPNTLPSWLDRISLEGDLMLRYEGDYFDPKNTPALTYNAITGANLGNTTQDTDRYRYRARIGLLAKMSDMWTGGFRIVSGDTDNPVATLQTLGNYSERGPITIDRAYIKWDPSEQWTLSAGRMANPYFNTDLVWDIDLSFEGAYGTYRPRFSDTLSGFVTGGAYLIQYQSPTPETPQPRNKYLIGLQAGIDWELTAKSKLKTAISLYDYKNIEGIPNPAFNSQVNDWTAPAFRQKGNTVFNIDNDGNPTTNTFALASKFNILNLTANLDLHYFSPFDLRLIGDYAKNLGFNRTEIQQRTGFDIDSKTTAWRTGFIVGKTEMKEWKDWQFFGDYRYIGADSVLDAFVDSEFYLGGTNAKGYTIGAQLGLAHNVWMRVRWMSADEISGPPLAIDILQLDLNARF